MIESLQILLIEDDPDDIDLFQYALRTNQVTYSLAVIMQGNEVAPYLSADGRQPDIIVMDLNLPVVHGREVLRQIKTSHAYRQVPLVVLTTSSANEDRDYCYAMGADEFITKPTTLQGFGTLVKSIVSMAQREH